MSYVEKNMVPGETLLYQTRHHWIVLLGPLFVALLLGIPGLWLLAEVAAKRPELAQYSASIPGGMTTALALGVILVVVALINLAWGMTKRNATEMAVTNRRVLIKTGLGQPAHSGPDAFPSRKHRRGGEHVGPHAGIRKRHRAWHRRHA